MEVEDMVEKGSNEQVGSSGMVGLQPFEEEDVCK